MVREQRTVEMNLTMENSRERFLAFSKKNLQEIINSPFVDDYEPPHQLGPDYLIPCNNQWTTSISGSVRLRLNEQEDEDTKPISVVTMFEKTVKKHPDKIALSVKRNNEWINWTYAEYWNEVLTIAKAFLKLGLKRFDVVSNLGFNSPEVFISHLAAMVAGGVTTGIYLTNSPSACEYILKHSKSPILVVENELQLKKILEIRNNLPDLKAIVQYIGTPTHDDVFSWEDLKRIGENVSDEVVNMRVRSLAINQCFSLVYTSGTTGNPKAVMLSHDNYVQLCCFLHNSFDFNRVYSGEMEYRAVSCLPLNHIAAQVLDIYMVVMLAGRIYFAQPNALKGSLIETLQEVRPTFFGCVPRVFEKMKEKFEEKLANMNFLMRATINWAMSCGYTRTMRILKGSPTTPFGYSVASQLLRKIRQQFGFSELMYSAIAGAPTNVDVLDFFLKLELVLQEAYGMSETAGPVCVNQLDSFKKLSAGRKNKITNIKIDNPDSSGNGEVCMRGRQIFMGYLENEESTKETIDADGWIHSGDIGNIDKEGHLFITGRIKELVITAGGENIAPTPIEDAVKAELPIISQCIVVGDRRKFLSMLLTMKTNIDMETMTPLNALSDVSIQWCKRYGSGAKTVQDILNGPDVKVMEAIQKGINRVNENAISNACRIQKWKILLKDFTVQDEELSPTMKLKRFYIQKKYKNVIDEMYKD